MKHFLLILILTGCSGGDFNAGMAITHDSGTTVLDSMRGGDAATAGDISLRVALTDGALQSWDSGVVSTIADSGPARHVHPIESGRGGTSSASDSGPTSTGGVVTSLDAQGGGSQVAIDAGSTVGTGGATTCGELNHICPCCRGYTCQLGRCL